MDDFAGRLLEGERVLWTGRPARGLLLMPADWVRVPFGLIWCGVSVFGTVAAARWGAHWFSVVFGAACVASGLYLVAGRFVLDAVIRRGTAYAVTDRRVLISRAGLPRSGRFRAFVALALDSLWRLDLTEDANGRGTLRFGPRRPPWGSAARFRGEGADIPEVWTPSLDPTPQFLAVADARRVFDLIQHLAHAAGRRPAASTGARRPGGLYLALMGGGVVLALGGGFALLPGGDEECRRAGTPGAPDAAAACERARSGGGTGGGGGWSGGGGGSDSAGSGKSGVSVARGGFGGTAAHAGSGG